MPIDWFTTIAQVFNFLLLVWLLKRFLYIPILNAIDTRQQYLDEELKRSVQLKEQASQQLLFYQQESTQLEQQKTQLLAKAHQQAEEHRDTMLQTTAQELKKLKAQRLSAIQDEFQQLQNSLATTQLNLLLKTSEKLFTELLDSSLHSRILMVFYQQLQAQPSGSLLQAITNVSSVVCKSAEPLSLSQRQQLETLLSAKTKKGAEQITIEYQLAPSLICGVELHIGDWKLSWNAQDYLQTLEQQISQNFAAKLSNLKVGDHVSGTQ